MIVLGVGILQPGYKTHKTSAFAESAQAPNLGWRILRRGIPSCGSLQMTSDLSGR